MKEKDVLEAYQKWKENKTMANYKTTLGALITLMSFLLPNVFKVELPAEVQTAMMTVGVFIIGFFAKDKNVTGGTKQQ